MSVNPPPKNPYALPPGGVTPAPTVPRTPPAYGPPPPGYPPQPLYPQPGYVQPGYVQPGYPQPGYPQPGYVQPGYAAPHDAWPSPPLPPLADWGTRVGASVIDGFLSGWPVIVAIVVLVATVDTHEEVFDGSGSILWFTPSTTGVLAYLAAALVSWSITLWNRVFLQGRTGQSIGKRVLGIRLVAEAGLRPVGALTAFLRELAHYADGVSYVGYLWPLWDARRRTFADMFLKTVVIKAR